MPQRGGTAAPRASSISPALQGIYCAWTALDPLAEKSPYHHDHYHCLIQPPIDAHPPPNDTQPTSDTLSFGPNPTRTERCKPTHEDKISIQGPQRSRCYFLYSADQYVHRRVIKTHSILGKIGWIQQMSVDDASSSTGESPEPFSCHGKTTIECLAITRPPALGIVITSTLVSPYPSDRSLVCHNETLTSPFFRRVSRSISLHPITPYSQSPSTTEQ